MVKCHFLCLSCNFYSMMPQDRFMAFCHIRFMVAGCIPNLQYFTIKTTIKLQDNNGNSLQCNMVTCKTAFPQLYDSFYWQTFFIIFFRSLVQPLKKMFHFIVLQYIFKSNIGNIQTTMESILMLPNYHTSCEYILFFIYCSTASKEVNILPGILSTSERRKLYLKAHPCLDHFCPIIFFFFV